MATTSQTTTTSTQAKAHGYDWYSHFAKIREQQGQAVSQTAGALGQPWTGTSSKAVAEPSKAILQQFTPKTETPTGTMPGTNLTINSDELFLRLKRGQLLAHPDQPEWNKMYVNGAATTEQKEAWQRWMNWKDTAQLSGDQLLTKMETGDLKVGDKLWNDMVLETGLTPAMQYAQERFESKAMVSQINQQTAYTNNILDTAYGNANVRSSQRLDDLYNQIANLGADLPSAAQMYQDLVVNNPALRELTTEYEDLKSDLIRVREQKLYLEDEITDLVQGEAPSGYIAALAQERSKNLYRKEFNIMVDMDRVSGVLESERQMASDMMKYTLMDNETRYNRMKDLLNYNLDMAKTEQAYQQQSFENEMAVQKLLYTLPPDKTITLGGVTYTGMGENKDINVLNWTEPDGSSYVVGYDKNTGEELYRTFIGKYATTAATSSGGGGGGGGSRSYSSGGGGGGSGGTGSYTLHDHSVLSSEMNSFGIKVQEYYNKYDAWQKANKNPLKYAEGEGGLAQAIGGLTGKIVPKPYAPPVPASLKGYITVDEKDGKYNYTALPLPIPEDSYVNTKGTLSKL